MNNRMIWALPRFTIIAGLSVWMTIAVLNNITDQGTNVVHLANMLSMRLLIEDPVFGNGLEWRAWSGSSAQVVLVTVIIWQVLTAFCLWVATFLMGVVAVKEINFTRALVTSNIALSMFIALWLLFMSGGLWFGYWMKQGAIQNVHMTLIIMSIAALIFINQPHELQKSKQ
ncbi:DUF2165 family protein [Polycladidibacter stylochi]|uniref:DUF2165 family protein n=1 Tax=Polycladidibacter stylochi TaxID=1807766 RepID=UPI00082AC4D5|nr:DUF2165 family protein [Pseudovibrio stylochi]